MGQENLHLGFVHWRKRRRNRDIASGGNKHRRHKKTNKTSHTPAQMCDGYQKSLSDLMSRKKPQTFTLNEYICKFLASLFF